MRKRMNILSDEKRSEKSVQRGLKSGRNSAVFITRKRTHCKHTAEDDLEVFSTDDLSLDWISAHNFLTRLQKLSSYASGHLEVSELAACLEKASFSNPRGHDEVF
ncbi:hypothetical protein Tco_0169519 [Tanacetum coccineum]